MQKNNNRFKKLKLKKEREKKNNSTELQKPNIEAEAYNINKKMCPKKKIKNKFFKSLIRFHTANKIGNYNGVGGAEGREKNEKKS